MLRWNLNLADGTGKLAQWRLRLMELDFEAIHRVIAKHQAANALSRLPKNRTGNKDIEDEIRVLAI